MVRTDSEAEILWRCGVALAAEVLVDDILVLAHAFLEFEEVLSELLNLCEGPTRTTHVCGFGTVLCLAWTWDLAACQGGSGKSEEKVYGLHLCCMCCIWKEIENSIDVEITEKLGFEKGRAVFCKCEK